MGLGQKILRALSHKPESSEVGGRNKKSNKILPNNKSKLSLAVNDIEFKGEPNLIQKCIVSNQIIIEVENFPNQQKIQLRSSHEYHKLKIIPIHKKHYNNKCRTK